MSRLPLRARVLVLAPALSAEATEAAWTRELVQVLSTRWPAVVALDPGPPAREHGRAVFALRAQRDFTEQAKEAIFEHPVDLILAVGEAACVANLERVAGWAPLVPRAGLWLGSDWARAITNPADRKACFNLCDLVMMAGDWHAGNREDSTVEFVSRPADAVEVLAARFGLWRGAWAASSAAEGRAVSILAADAAAARAARVLTRVSGGEVLEIGSGGAAAWNRMIRRARHERLLFLGPGTTLARQGLSRLHDYLDNDERLAAVGALRAQGPARGGVERAQAAHMLLGKGHREHDRIVESACWLVRREAFRLGGLFDERFPGYAAAALDCSLRLRQAGLRVMTATDVLCWPWRSNVLSASDLTRLGRKWREELTGLLVSLSCGGQRP